MDVYTNWILEGLQKPGKNRKGLAKALKRSQSAVTQMLNPKNGKPRKLKTDEIEPIAVYLEMDPPYEADPPRRSSVRLVGYVGAGAAMIAFAAADDPDEEVDAPEGATEETVAVEIRGDSLGSLFDRWLVFYDEIRNPPTSSMLGRLCVVGLADGRILVKQLKRGQLEKHYNLLSNTEPPIYDAIVEWAAIVKQMSPR